VKIQELRKLLSASERGNLEKAFAETYKQLRKPQKDEIDQLLTDILEGKSVKEARKEKESINFSTLEQDIKKFIENAYAQNYFAPNRVILKKDRPKWRFLVKGYIKELEKISAEDADYPAAVKLLQDLYGLICAACDYYYFSTDDPFRSIGYNQSDFFRIVVKKTFAGGYSRENISVLLLQATSGGLSRESVYAEQEMALLAELKTSDVKYIALEEAKKLVEERNQKLEGLKQYSDQRYLLERAVNELCNMILMISIALAEPEEAVEYYLKNARHHSEEVVLYCALEVVEMFGDDELWVKVYEKGLAKKIKPRDYLRSKYGVLTRPQE